VRSNSASVELSSVEMSGSKYTNFGKTYASAYDTIYQSKNYAAESRFVIDQLRRTLGYAPRHILDLGCGTGLHAVQMAHAGILTTGVDGSGNMIEIARKRKKALSPEVRKRLQFRIGDIRGLELCRRYDAAVSLFHVMSYVTANEDLEATFWNVRRHLVPGGAFLFDFWYGPAVLRDPPKRRKTVTQASDVRIRRKTRPEWDPHRCMVRVNYDIEIENVASGEIVREREQHAIRYYFADELERCLGSCGFRVVRFGEALTGEVISDSKFSVYVLARARQSD
jgi:SAM-dependent methyltransferase